MRLRNRSEKNNIKAIKSIFIMSALCLFALLYVWQHVAIVKLGYKIKKDEIKYEEMLDEKARLESLISRLESPENIDRLLAMSNINLSLMKNPKVVRIRS